MPTTTNYTWTYPDATGSTQLWTHFQTLATAIDTSLKTVSDAQQTYRASQLLSSSAASVTFSSIPRTLKTLRLAIAARGDTAATFQSIIMRLGGDSSAVYNICLHLIQNGGATGGATATTAAATSALIGYMPAATATSNRFSSNTVEIGLWDSPTGHTTGCQWQISGGYNVGITNYVVVTGGSGEYTGTATLNSITLLPTGGNFVAGSEFVLTGQY